MITFTIFGILLYICYPIYDPNINQLIYKN